MYKKIGILVVVVALLASMTISSALACITYTPGYWKNHPEDWPVDLIEIGGITYTKSQAIRLLRTPPRGDAWIILAQKVIAAKLSMLAEPGGHWSNPANFGGINFATYVANANAWLASPGNRADAITYAETIDYWLNFWNVD